MTTILLYCLLAGTTISTLKAAWVGVVGYYVLSILYPQIIWYWIFLNIRATFFISTATIISYLKEVVLGNVSFSSYKTRQNCFIIILWICICISFFFNPYGLNDTLDLTYNTNYLFSTFNKIFIFYFISVSMIKKKFHYHVLIVAFIGCVLYFTYYANITYLNGHYGRLAGPTSIGGGSIYSDENVFAMIFVVCMPFLYFMGNYYKNIIIKCGLWLAIPFTWHAVFLTGSLGGLIGLSIVMLFVALRAKRKSFMIALPIALIIAFISQGGQYLKEKASGAEEGGITEVGTAQTRFQSWGAGFKMMMAHPITGVGPGNFYKHYSDYADTQPFVAHNTFIQFSAETGVLSGMMYLLIGLGFLTTYYKQRVYDKEENFDSFLLATKESITGGIIGFYVCATFLNLATYESYYYLLVCKAVQDKLTIECATSLKINKH